MRVLVTGASGFVGPHLIQELEQHGHIVIPTSLKNSPNPCDLLDEKAVEKLVRRTKPQAVVHLAGMSNLGKSWKNVAFTIDANTVPTRHLCRALEKTHSPALFLLVSTATVFDLRSEKTFDEKSRPKPKNPYAASKLAAEYLLRSFESRRLKTYIARPLNHTGPGQTTEFAVPAFAKRIIEARNGGVITVGNINVKRDISDVRDIVRAYRLILEKKPRERLFVLGTGKAAAMKDILREFSRLSGKKISLRVDMKLLRPSDPKSITVNPALAKKVLGWKAQIPLKQTLRDVYNSVSTR